MQCYIIHRLLRSLVLSLFKSPTFGRPRKISKFHYVNIYIFKINLFTYLKYGGKYVKPVKPVQGRSFCSAMPKRVFVTVGSTRFPQLIRSVLSSEAIEILVDLGFRELCIQHGTDTELFKRSQEHTKLSITGFDYSPSIEKEMQQADLIISHAGTKSLNCVTI